MAVVILTAFMLVAFAANSSLCRTSIDATHRSRVVHYSPSCERRSGVDAMGIYSIRGRGVLTPTAMTVGNFGRSVSMTFLTSTLAFSSVHLEPSGILLTLISEVVVSGIGYVLWYSVLRSLTTT